MGVRNPQDRELPKTNNEPQNAVGTLRSAIPMKPSPLKKGSELFDQAFALYQANRSASEFAIAKLKREVQRQIDAVSDDGNAYGALMFLNILERDLDGLKATYRRAKALVNIEPALFSNASMAFTNFGESDEGWNIAAEGLRRYPNTPSIFETAIRIATITGRARAAAALSESYRKATGEEAPGAEMAAQMAAFYQKNEVTDDQGALVIAPMITALSKFTHSPADGEHWIVHFGEDVREGRRAVVRFSAHITPSESIEAIDAYLDMVIGSGVPRRIQRILSADVDCISGDEKREAA